MAQYPRSLIDRFPQQLGQLMKRVKKLESRTASIDSGFPLAALPAVVSASYSSGDPQVYLNGAAALTGPYQHLASYTPAANDQVLALPVPALRTYIILGKYS